MCQAPQTIPFVSCVTTFTHMPNLVASRLEWKKSCRVGLVTPGERLQGHPRQRSELVRPSLRVCRPASLYRSAYRGHSYTTTPKISRVAVVFLRNTRYLLCTVKFVATRLSTREKVCFQRESCVAISPAQNSMDTSVETSSKATNIRQLQ